MRDAAFLVVLVLLGYGLELGLLGLKAENPNQLLVDRVTNRVFTGYFNLAASATSADAFFSHYPDVFSTKICPHCHDHPPGPALFYWGSIKAAEALPAGAQRRIATAIWKLLGDSPTMAALRTTVTDGQAIGAFLGGSLVLLLASMLVLPLFGLARLVGPPGYEYLLSGLGLALPGLMLMSPQFDQVLATLAASAAYLGLQGLKAHSTGQTIAWALAAGLVVGIGMLFSWAFGTVGLILVVLGLACLLGSRELLFARDWQPAKLPFRQGAVWVVCVGLGAALLLVGLVVVAGLDLPYILKYNLANAALAESQRPYLVWVFHGPLDFLQFLGLPLAVMSIAALFVERNPRRTSLTTEDGLSKNRFWSVGRILARLNVYAILFWGIVLAIDLAGRSKAEQGRLLIFLMPLALLGVYYWIGRATPGRAILALLFISQMLITIVIGARWFVP